MIAGGTEAAITPMGVGGFAAMRALSTRNDAPEKASRPWDSGRDGFVIGEGAGILVLEELEFARRRGAKILAEIVGYGMSGDAHHMTQPAENGDGAYRVMLNTLNDAKLQPQRVGYINAHGTSTNIGDKVETIAIKRAFGDHAYKLAVSSTKSMTGHLLGGAGGLEAGITVLALRDQMLPPTVNLEILIPSAILITSPTRPEKRKWNTPCQIRLASAERMERCSSAGGRNKPLDCGNLGLAVRLVLTSALAREQVVSIHRHFPHSGRDYVLDRDSPSVSSKRMSQDLRAKTERITSQHRTFSDGALGTRLPYRANPPLLLRPRRDPCQGLRERSQRFLVGNEMQSACKEAREMN